MAFESYITYDEYLELGGKVPLDAFPVYERKAQRMLDYVTFNRIPKLPEIIDEVKEALTEFIDRLYDYENDLGSEIGLSKYSNGVETIEYTGNGKSKMNKELVKLAKMILPDYLTARSVGFDVEKYLQSVNNSS